jgi:acyl-CoA reductase-like NAD-dependent aldehyde dehydrogenase
VSSATRSEPSSAPVTWRQYIDGEWIAADSDRTFEDRDPYDGSLVANISAGSRNDAERAIAAASAAFPAWAELAPMQKQRLFLNAADVLERRTPDVVAILAAETGCGRAFAMFQINWSINLLRQVADWGYRPVGDVLRSEQAGRFVMAVRKPLGVVAGITPWNGAHNLAWRTALLPMAFGNTMVLKPSEESPISAGLILAEVLEEAGFPKGVFNVITHAPGEAGPIADAIFESPEVRSINFTGSSATGRMLGRRAGESLKRIVLELGGYNPLIVLGDADLDQAVDASTFGAFFHQGQICMNTRKVLVERSILEPYVERLVAKTKTLPQGDPKLPLTIIGPLINDRAAEMVKSNIQDAVSRGARILTGGGIDGRVVEPTILIDVSPDSIAYTEETFGPVLIVEPVENAEEAIAKANATRYGLSASIVTGDHQRGLAFADRLHAGMVHVNGATMAGEPGLPNGGVKDSGWGRSGYYAIEDFTEVRLMTMTRGATHYPF